jgi:hypothetical protein
VHLVDTSHYLSAVWLEVAQKTNSGGRQTLAKSGIKGSFLSPPQEKKEGMQCLISNEISVNKLPVIKKVRFASTKWPPGFNLHATNI